MMFGGNGGIVWAERTIPSGIAGADRSPLVPLWMAADRPGRSRAPAAAPVVIGLAVGFVGAALLVGGNALEGEIDTGRAGARARRRRVLGRGLALPRHAPLPSRPLVGRGDGDAGRGRDLRRRGRSRGRARGHPHRVDLSGVVARARVPRRVRVVDRLHLLPVAAPQRADVARRDLRLRDAGRRRVPRLGCSSTSRSRPSTLLAGVIIVVAVASRSCSAGGAERARRLRRRSARDERRTRAQPRGRSRPVAGWVRPGPAR